MLAVNEAPQGADNTIPILEDASHPFVAGDFGFSDPNNTPSNTLQSVTIVTLPSPGSLTRGGVAVAVGDEIPVAAIPNLRYTPALNGNGASYAWFTFRVKDNGGTANGGVDTAVNPATITFDVTAVNDAPVRLSGNPSPISVDQNSKNITAVPLGLSGLSYGPGGGTDEQSQTLTYTVTQIPSFVELFKSDGTTAVTADSNVTLAELQQLTYKTVTNANGTGTVKWTVVDTGSNTAPSSNTLGESLAITVQADDTPPSAPQRPVLDTNSDTGSKGDGKTTAVRPSITVVGPADAASLSITLSNSAASPQEVSLAATRDSGTDTWRATPLSDLAVGVWSVTAKAKDAANNESASSEAFSLKIESVPATPITPDLEAASDSGASNSDDITNVTRPKFSGTALAGSTVELFATKAGAAAVSLGTALTDATSGAWDLTPTASKALPDGIYDITAVTTDTSGNTSAPSAPLAVTIDTTPPDAPTAPVLLALDDSGKLGDSLTNVTKPRFQGTAAANAPITLVATLSEPSDKGTATADADGKWTIRADTLSDGLWTIQARATDLAGNRSKLSAETKLTISTIVPGAPTVNIYSTEDTGFSPTDGITNVTTPTFFGTAGLGATVAVYRQNTTNDGFKERLGSVIANKTDGKWTLPFDSKAVVPFVDAVYQITAIATDESGTESAEGRLATGLTVDTTAPTLDSLTQATVQTNQAVHSVSATFNEEVLGLAAADFDLAVTNNGVRRPLTLAGTATVTPVAPGATHEDSWTVGNLAKITGASGSYALALNKARLDAGKTAAQDLAGNLLTFSSTTATWTTDTTAPTVRTMTAVLPARRQLRRRLGTQAWLAWTSHLMRASPASISQTSHSLAMATWCPFRTQ